MNNYWKDAGPGLLFLMTFFDDVLTAGSHFKAMKNLLLQHIPDACILGLFVARTTRGAQII